MDTNLKEYNGFVNVELEFDDILESYNILGYEENNKYVFCVDRDFKYIVRNKSTNEIKTFDFNECDDMLKADEMLGEIIDCGFVVDIA